MNSLEILDESLNYLNNENYNFYSLIEFANFSFKNIVEKVNKIIDIIIKSIKKFKLFIKKKLTNLKEQYRKRSRQTFNNSIKNNNDNIEDIDSNKYSWNDYIFVYDDDLYDEAYLLVKGLLDTSALGEVQIVASHCVYDSIDTARANFENFESSHNELNMDIKIKSFLSTGSEKEYKKAFEEHQRFLLIIDNQESYVHDILVKFKKYVETITNKYEDNEKQERLQIMLYLIERVRNYNAILMKIISETTFSGTTSEYNLDELVKV